MSEPKQDYILVNIDATGALYAIRNGKDLDDNVKFQLSARIAQLDAMLALTTGEGHKTFEGLNSELQNNYLWACSMMATEIRVLSELAK
jgi:hypothetical protein